MTVLFKTCNKCNEVKELSEYHVNTTQLHGKMNTCKSCRRAANIEDYKTNKDRYTSWNLYSNYGITLDTYNSMLSSQNGVCAICKQAEVTKRKGEFKRLSVDHNHTTGQVRALLCHACNIRLGYHEGDYHWTDLANRYLSHHARNPSGITKEDRQTVDAVSPIPVRKCLTDEQIQEIRAKHADGCHTYSVLSYQYKVSTKRISAILKVTN